MIVYGMLEKCFRNIKQGYADAHPCLSLYGIPVQCAAIGNGGFPVPALGGGGIKGGGIDPLKGIFSDIGGVSIEGHTPHAAI